MNGTIITTERLVKAYGQVRALDGLSLEIPQGIIYGLLGPNGAGRTALIRVLATLLHAAAWTFGILGVFVPLAVRTYRRTAS